MLALADTRKENSFTIEVDDFEQLHASEDINCLSDRTHPPRGRVAKLSWKKEPVQVDLRHCSESEMKLAFQINRFGGAGPIRVY